MFITLGFGDETFVSEQRFFKKYVKIAHFKQRQTAKYTFSKRPIKTRWRKRCE